MKTDIKQVNVLAPKWWNPLFWLVVVLAPVFGSVAGVDIIGPDGKIAIG